jgi:DNA-binding MarR family transcriptional regulator
MTDAASLPPRNQRGVVVELTKILPSCTEGEALLSQVELLREQLGTALRTIDQLAQARGARATGQPIEEKEVRTLINLRRSRGRFFGGDLFADPAWDILLELYAASLGQFRMTVGKLCIGAAVPATTALRWINHLEENGMIERKSDPTDGRRQFLMLSAYALEAMNGYFRTVPAGSPLI